MRSYGANKATEFTRKQIGVIYRMAKNGELEVEKGMISHLYDLAEYYGYDDNGSVAAEEAQVMNILEAVFSNNVEEAQERIESFQKSYYECLTSKAKKNYRKEIM